MGGSAGFGRTGAASGRGAIGRRKNDTTRGTSGKRSGRCRTQANSANICMKKISASAARFLEGKPAAPAP
jgi:hypothetical protein